MFPEKRDIGILAPPDSVSGGILGMCNIPTFGILV